MKRPISRMLTIAAFLAFGASAFAQLTFNGYYRVGGVYDSDGIKSYSAAPDNLVTLQDRIRLNISYAAPDDMYGFKSRLQADTAYSSSGAPTSAIANLFVNSSTTKATGTGTPAAATYATTDTWSNWKFAEGYAKFLDGMFKVSAGRLDITDYEVAQNVGNVPLGYVYSDETAVNAPLLGGQKGKTTGAILQTWPIENFSAAVVMRTDGTQYYKTHHYGLDAYYMVPGVGKALFASNLGYLGATTNNTQETLDKSYASLGFSYTGYPGLSATAVYRYNGYVLNSEGKYSYANGAVAIVEYSSGPLFADLSGDFDFTNSHRYIEGEVSYLIIPQVKVRGYFGYTDSTTMDTNVVQLYVNSIACNSLMGVDIVLPIGKTEVSLGLDYADKAKIQIPLLVKANF
jgi:hypothetical protein